MHRRRSSILSVKRAATLIALLGLMLSVAVGGIAPTREAAAGSNGQQIQVNWCYATSITFKGYNQYGQWSVRTFPTYNGTTKTNGWWWVGDVTIISHQWWGDGYKTINVPRSQWWSDWTITNGCT